MAKDRRAACWEPLTESAGRECEAVPINRLSLGTIAFKRSEGATIGKLDADETPQLFVAPSTLALDLPDILRRLRTPCNGLGIAQESSE